VNHGQLIGVIVERIHQRALWYMITPDSRKIRGYGGWPDITLMSPYALMLREVKTTGDILRPMQRWAGNRLLQMGLDWAVWTEQDLQSGRVDAELDSLRR
jgi:hypothetical protein